MKILSITIKFKHFGYLQAVMDSWFYARKYFDYLISAKTKHGVHSPFVFELITEVFPQDSTYYVFEKIEAQRGKLLRSTKTIEVTDFGAGSKVSSSSTRRVRGIAKHALKSKKYAQLIFRLVERFQPTTIMELGTSLGITTLYLASAKSDATVHTFEGCPETATIARQQFDLLKAENIQLHLGNIDDTLKNVLAQTDQLDLAFIDGNHREEPTIRYFEECLEKSHANTVIILDDIHWSQEMDAAWEKVKNHPKVKLTLDLFHLGIVFFREEQQEREHFVIRF